MSTKTDGLSKRFQSQRWIMDAVIRTVGMEWDQARLHYMGAPGGAEGLAEFMGIGARVKHYADIERQTVVSARRRMAKAEAFEEAGHLVSAGQSYFIAAMLWAAARWPIFEINQTLIDYDEKMNACYAKFITYADRPISRVEIPYGDTSLPAYLHLPREPGPDERFPAVIGIDGMDACKEIMVSMAGDRLLDRGIAVLAMDGPGQGECCTRSIKVTERNHMDTGLAAFEWLAGQPQIDAGRIGLNAVSFGSYFGTQAAIAIGDALKACAVAAVCHEPGAHTIFNMASPTFKARFMFMSGYDDEDEFDRFRLGLDLRPLIGGLKTPYLIVAGEDDQLSPLEFTEALFDRVGAPKRLVVYEGADHGMGGAPSTQLGPNWQTLIADWLADRLDGKPMHSERLFVANSGRVTRSPA